MTAESRQNHSHTVPGGRGFWWTDQLWEASAGLTPFTIAITDVPELDRNCWFRGPDVTIRQVAEHARRINDADLSYPIILSASGGLMDGGHRLAKAWLEGRAEIEAVRFEVDPEPDRFLPDGP
ncbi:hypothetical protein BH11ACT8_BH11ACT8_04570 [soil metagenome]